jgi:hypothetical protein
MPEPVLAAASEAVRRARCAWRDVHHLLEEVELTRPVHLLEACVPNVSGKGHHDSDTGHPCSITHVQAHVKAVAAQQQAVVAHGAARQALHAAHAQVAAQYAALGSAAQKLAALQAEPKKKSPDERKEQAAAQADFRAQKARLASMRKEQAKLKSAAGKAERSRALANKKLTTAQTKLDAAHRKLIAQQQVRAAKEKQKQEKEKAKAANSPIARAVRRGKANHAVVRALRSLDATDTLAMRQQAKDMNGLLKAANKQAKEMLARVKAGALGQDAYQAWDASEGPAALRARKEQLVDEAERIERARAAAVRSALLLPEGEATPVTLHDDPGASGGEKAPPEQAAAFQEAAQWLTSLVRRGKGGEELPAFSLALTEPRPYCASDDRYINTGLKGDITTGIHELGHAIEDLLPGAGEAAQAFLAYRTAGSPLVKMKDVCPKCPYADDEMGNIDSFDRAFARKSAAYIGKSYESGVTEILAMGVEKLYSDPVRFARDDPEYAAFVVGVLNGSLRGKGGAGG